MKGTRVTATDLETGESETVEIVDDYVLICDGRVRPRRMNTDDTLVHIILDLGKEPIDD